MRPPLYSLLGAVAGVVVSLADTGEASLCSIAPFPTGRDSTATYFLGRAVPETVAVTQGRISPLAAAGHWGNGRVRPLFGQVVRVDTGAGAGSELLYRTFAQRGNRDVVIVPWDYDAGCQPTYWTASAQWILSDRVGFYALRLRPVEEWSGGRPTFDARQASATPYPHGPFFAAGYGGTGVMRTSPYLAAAELFDLYGVLPTSGTGTRPTDLDPVLRWRDANPGLARQYPADKILSAVLPR